MPAVTLTVMPGGAHEPMTDELRLLLLERRRRDAVRRGRRAALARSLSAVQGFPAYVRA